MLMFGGDIRALAKKKSLQILLSSGQADTGRKINQDEDEFPINAH